jgi:hypothetical protein
MGCGNKTKNTCGEKNYATCIYYEKEVPTFSELTDCITLEETTGETYNLIKDLREQIDLSALGERCLEYILDENDKIIVKNVLLKYEEEICALKAKVEELEEKNISEMLIADWGLTFPEDCLELPCDNSILTVKDLFQALIDKACNP